MGRISSRLRNVFDRSEGELGPTIPIRKTLTGIWVPTPLRVIGAIFESLKELSLLGCDAVPRVAIDAGAGDGRVVCVLASMDPNLTLYGVELDPVLFSKASINLEALDAAIAGRAHLLLGDYLDSTTYDAHDLNFNSVDLVFSYPDGHESGLARFVLEYGSDSTKLCLWSTDRDVSVCDLDLECERDIVIAGELPWRLSVYGRK